MCGECMREAGIGGSESKARDKWANAMMVAGGALGGAGAALRADDAAAAAAQTAQTVALYGLLAAGGVGAGYLVYRSMRRR